MTDSSGYFNDKSDLIPFTRNISSEVDSELNLSQHSIGFIFTEDQNQKTPRSELNLMDSKSLNQNFKKPCLVSNFDSNISSSFIDIQEQKQQVSFI